MSFLAKRNSLLIFLASLMGSTASAASEVLIRDPAVLAALEDSGLSLNHLLLPLKNSTNDNASLYRESPIFRTITDHIESELNVLAKNDKKLSITMSGSHRLFDARWLKSSSAKFELAGVVNRLDRMPFDQAHCGEVRLVYRLKYRLTSRGEKITSRLPFSINLVYWQEKVNGSCAAVAKSWNDSGAIDEKLIKLNGISHEAPFHFSRLTDSRRKAVEINFQSVRWPSTIRPDLGNHAEYILRVFAKNSAGVFGLSKLENTPDIELLMTNKAKKDSLLKWLLLPSNLEMLDEGLIQVPDEYLATKATSISPRGFTRAANRPWSRLFSEKEVNKISFEKMKYLKSPAAVLRRLDDMSCIGCHQA